MNLLIKWKNSRSIHLYKEIKVDYKQALEKSTYKKSFDENSKIGKFTIAESVQNIFIHDSRLKMFKVS